MNLVKCLSVVSSLAIIGHGPLDVDISSIEPETQIEQCIYTEEDLRYLASLIYAEAGNQCVAGQQAVGIIVMNRCESEDFENEIYEVIYEPDQFTPVKNGMLKNCLYLYDNDFLPDSCIDAAVYALEGNKEVVYKGEVIDLSDYYFFSRELKNERCVIQDHEFK